MEYKDLLDFLKDGTSFDVSVGNETFYSALYKATLKTASETFLRFTVGDSIISLSKHRIEEIKISDNSTDLTCANNIFATIKKI